MIITFTKTGAGTYTTLARREDGVLLEVPSYDRTAPLPHDLAHYVVEQDLGLQQGFWGCVAAGALFPGIKVVCGRQPPHAADRSRAIIREAGQYGTEAEVLVGSLLRVMHAGLEAHWPAAGALLAREWRPSKPSRSPLGAEEVKRVCTALREAERRWQALAVGESITVVWSAGPATPRSRARGGNRRRRKQDHVASVG
jgi:hypothetical protein